MTDRDELVRLIDLFSLWEFRAKLLETGMAVDVAETLCESAISHLKTLSAQQPVAWNDAEEAKIEAEIRFSFDEYVAGLTWSDRATDHEKTLVIGNLRSLYAAISEKHNAMVRRVLPILQAVADSPPPAQQGPTEEDVKAAKRLEYTKAQAAKAEK